MCAPSRVSIVVIGGVETGTKVETYFHMVAEQSIGRLLGESCHSSVDLERMRTSLEKNQACSGKDNIFELQIAVEWKAVVSRGADERTQMNSMPRVRVCRIENMWTKACP